MRLPRITKVVLALAATVAMTTVIIRYHEDVIMFSYNREVLRSRPPNIVFILADDLGWNDVGYHGAEFPTPHLDALAESGVKLESYYVQPKCSPTRGQLLTGRYQIHTGLQSMNMPCDCPCGLPLEFPTLADKLQEAGYATHMVGKWHLGMYKRAHLPTHRGFESHYGYYRAAQDYYNHSMNGALDFHFNEKPLWDEEGYSTELYRDRAVKIMEDHISDTPEKPLFLYLAFQAVHTPNQVPSEYIRGLSHIKNHERKIHGGMTVALDQAVGHVKSALEETGLWDNTILIFSSDNGGQPLYGGSNWPLRGAKGSFWEGGIRSAAFVSSPLLPRGGATSHELMHVTDWFPTFLGLAGWDTSGLGLDGHDLWQTISEGTPSPRKELLHNIDPLHNPRGEKLDGSPFDVRTLGCLRMGDWKILTGAHAANVRTPPPGTVDPDRRGNADVRDRRQNLWLFNIAADPEESHNLAAEHPEVVTSMLKKLSAYSETAREPMTPTHDKAGKPPPGGVWGPWRD